jgi:hypothetical protein
MWGLWYLHCTGTTSYFLCELQGRDSDPERHPFCFYCTGLFQDYTHHQSQTSVWCGDLCIQLPKGGYGTSSHTSVGYTNFQYASCIIYLRHFWYYSDTTIYITGWGQVEIQGYIHLGMQMPTICTTYLDFAQDTSRILGW